LLPGVHRKIGSRPLLDRGLEPPDELHQLVGAQVHVQFHAAFPLDVRYNLLERVDFVLGLRLQTQNNVAVHLNETAITVIRRAFVAHHAGEAGGGLIVQADV
jgi:hypothetical protein